MSHITPRKEGRSGHLFKIEMMLLCNSISLGDDLSDGKLQTALYPFLRLPMMIRAMAMPNCSSFKSPPPFSAECRQNIKISERYQITRIPGPELGRFAIQVP